MLKHLPTDALQECKNHFYSAKNQCILQVKIIRKNHNSEGLTYTGLNAAQQVIKKQLHAKDLNIDDRISLFKEQLKNEFVYRIPLTTSLTSEKLICQQK